MGATFPGGPISFTAFWLSRRSNSNLETTLFVWYSGSIPLYSCRSKMRRDKSGLRAVLAQEPHLAQKYKIFAYFARA